MGTDDDEGVPGDDPFKHEKLNPQRLEKRERMKRWARSRPEFGLGQKGSRPPKKPARASSDTRTTEEREEDAISPAGLASHADRVSKVVKAAWDLLPSRMGGRFTFGNEFRQLVAEVENSKGLSRQERDAIYMRLAKVRQTALMFSDMLEGKQDILDWACNHPWADTAKPLASQLKLVETALLDENAGGLEDAANKLRQLQAEWGVVSADCAKLCKRYAAIQIPLASLPTLALRLPRSDVLTKTLLLPPRLAPLGGEATMAAVVNAAWEALRAPLATIEQVCGVVVGAPTLVIILDAVEKLPFKGGWKELDAALKAIADAIGNGDAGALAKQLNLVSALLPLVDQAELDVADLRRLLKEAHTAMHFAAKAITSACDAADPEGWGGWKLLNKLEPLLPSPLTGAVVPADIRIDLRNKVVRVRTWACAAESAIKGSPQMLDILKEAQKVSTASKARTQFLFAFDNLEDTDRCIADAYAGLLKVNGPWKARMKLAGAVGPLSLFLQGWGLALVDADDLAAEMVGVTGEAQNLLTTAGLTLVNYNALRLTCPNLAELLSLVKSYPRNDTLAHLAVFRRFRAVSPANLAELVARNQVVMSGAGHRNPFCYNCSDHGPEAEAKADVVWKHDLGGPSLKWGVVHIHYHGRRNSTPDGDTWYHVKEDNFTPSKGELTDGPAIALVDAVIPYGEV